MTDKPLAIKFLWLSWFFMIVLTFFFLTFGVAHAEIVTINTTKTTCYPFKGLWLATPKWHLVGQYERERYTRLAGKGKIQYISADTLRCVYIDDDKTVIFLLSQHWWRKK